MHPLSPVCTRVEPLFYRLFGFAGGALSQSLIYSGPFEIIELTHLSDGERRNAKRSLGEVPAAPAPNLSCLQIAQSLHHSRWDSCLSFLPHTHTHVRERTERTHKCGKRPSHLSTHARTHTEVQSHQALVTDKTGKQADMYRTHLQTHAHTCTHARTHAHTNTRTSFPSSFTVSLGLTCTLYSSSPGLISMYKVSISCLQGTSLPHSQSTEKKGQTQSH